MTKKLKTMIAVLGLAFLIYGCPSQKQQAPGTPPQGGTTGDTAVVPPADTADTTMQPGDTAVNP